MDAEQAEAGPVTVSRVSEETDAAEGLSAAAELTAAGAVTGTPATDDAPAPEVAEEAATFPAGAQEPVVGATVESEAAVEEALGGSGSLSGDTAAPKKRGLRVRRAAKRPAGPPSVSG